jgi:hypothetical protein
MPESEDQTTDDQARVDEDYLDYARGVWDQTPPTKNQNNNKTTV